MCESDANCTADGKICCDYQTLCGVVMCVMPAQDTGMQTEKQIIVGWLDFCFTALQHILGHFGCGQLTLPHCSWASLLGSLPVLSAHSFVSN